MYELIKNVITNIDEKFIEEASSCLPEKFDNESKKQITIKAEDLIEMKKQIKKSNLIAKIVAVAAAFICVATVSVFLIVNNNKVPVLNSGTENSVISDPFEVESEESDDQTKLTEEESKHISALSLFSFSQEIVVEKEYQKDNYATQLVDYNGGKINITADIVMTCDSDTVPDYMTTGWYVTLNGIPQNITVDGKEHGLMYIHEVTKDEYDSKKTHSYKMEISFEPVISVKDKDSELLTLSVIKVFNPHYEIGKNFVNPRTLHGNTMVAFRTCKINTPITNFAEDSVSQGFESVIITNQVKREYNQFISENTYDQKADAVIFDKNKKNDFRLDENGSIELGIALTCKEKALYRVLLLINGKPAKFPDNSYCVEVEAAPGYLQVLEGLKFDNLEPYDSINVLVVRCVDENGLSELTTALFKPTILPYNYGEYQNNSNTENSDTSKSEADEARENVTSLTLFGYANNSSAENEYTENGKNYIDYTGEELVINFDMDISCDSDTVPDKMSMGFYILVEGVLQDTISVDGKEVKGVYIHYLAPEDFDARKKHNLKLKFSFTPKVAEVDKDKKELKVTLIRILHPHYKAVPGYVALGPAIHSSSGAYGFTCKVKAPIETTVNDKISDGFSTVLVTDEVKKKYNNLLNDSLYESGYACVMNSNYKSDLTLDENGEIELGICVVSGIKAKYRLILLVNGIPTEFPDGSSCMELEANAGYLSYIEGQKFTNLKPYDSVGVKMIRCADGYPGSFSDMNNQKFVVKPCGSD